MSEKCTLLECYWQHQNAIALSNTTSSFPRFSKAVPVYNKNIICYKRSLIPLSLWRLTSVSSVMNILIGCWKFAVVGVWSALLIYRDATHEHNGSIAANDNLLSLAGSPQNRSVDRKGPSHVIVMSLLSQLSRRKIQKRLYKAAARSHRSNLHQLFSRTWRSKGVISTVRISKAVWDPPWNISKTPLQYVRYQLSWAGEVKKDSKILNTSGASCASRSVGYATRHFSIGFAGTT